MSDEADVMRKQIFQGELVTADVADTSAIKSALSVKQGGSEEHTSELQSRLHLVCRLLLEKKKKTKNKQTKTNKQTKNKQTNQQIGLR